MRRLRVSFADIYFLRNRVHASRRDNKPLIKAVIQKELIWGFVVIVRKLWYDVIRLTGEKKSVTDYRSK